jgi:fibrillarin-like pre-rRNA processing protein
MIEKKLIKKDNQIFTLNLVPGVKQFSERIEIIEGKEWRMWDPYRSKLAAAIANGLKNWPIKNGQKILYLGIANGQTASHISDIIGQKGIIYGIEISERPFRELLPVAEARGNIAAILADARKPQDYDWIEQVDVIYQDVATPDQAEILIRNCKFLKPNGIAMIAIKARSVDVVRQPKEIYKEVLEKLKERFEILEKIELDPYEKDHMFVLLRLK